MQLSQLVPLLSASLGVPGVRQREDGSSGFHVEGVDVLLIQRPAAEAAFVVRARLGRIDTGDFEPVLEQLMHANFFDDGIGGPVLGLDAEGAVFLTQYFREGSFSWVQFMDSIHRFIASARRRHQAVLDANQARPPATEVLA